MAESSIRHHNPIRAATDEQASALDTLANAAESYYQPPSNAQHIHNAGDDGLGARKVLPLPPGGIASGHMEEEKQPVKRSWRRKYRKMRARFHETINESNALIKAEHKCISIARRLQEQNDQLLDLLLDLNTSVKMPPSLRFDLDLTPGESAVPSLEADVKTDPIAVQNIIQDARADLAAGNMTPEEFAELETKLHSSRTNLKQPQSLSQLDAKTPHTSEAPAVLPEGLLLGDNAPGYLDLLHKEEYLDAIDQALKDPAFAESPFHDGRPLPTPRHQIPNEKDLTLQNPDSVYNWLRKHQPQVFLQDKDPAHPENLSEKSSAKTGGGRGGGKRQSAVGAGTPAPKAEQDLDEEIGYAENGGAGGGKGKRSKDDEPYRPKGGSSRPAKRKREDGEVGPRGGKKKSRASAASTA